MEEEKRRFFHRDTFVYVLVSTVIFGFAVHGYAYFNLLYSHDSLLVNQGRDAGQMIGVGRFSVPLYLKFRGDFYPPALVGMLSLLFLASAIYIAVRLLSLRDKPMICLLCGVLTSSITLTLINATYIKDADVYMLALLLGAAGVYLCARFRYGLAAGAVLLCLSMGLYQAMFQAAVFLAMIWVLRRILERAEVKEILLSGLKAVGMLLLGLILYAVAVQLAVRVTGQPLIDSYNGLGGIGQFGSLSDILRLLAETYCYPFLCLLKPEIFHSRWMALLNCLLLVLAAALLVRLAVVRRIRGWNAALLAAVVLLMPFGMNVVYFISKGVVHLVMIFSFYLFYVLLAMLLEMSRQEEAAGWQEFPRRILRCAVPCVLAALILNSAIYANSAYLKKHLEYQTTLSTMTRIVDRIEQLEGYVSGETPVAIMGSLADSRISRGRDGLGRMTGTGLLGTFSVTYETTYSWYFDQILSYPITLVGLSEEARAEADGMPSFPAAGSCRMVDGTAVVRLS